MNAGSTRPRSPTAIRCACSTWSARSRPAGATATPSTAERVREPDGIHLNEAGAGIAAGRGADRRAPRLRGLRMRRALLLAAVAAALGPGAGAAAAADVLVVGDSLEVGTGPHLKRELAGREVEVDARTGRPSPEGLQVLRSLLRPGHRVMVFDLGTNDDPSRPAVAARQPGRRPVPGRGPLPGDLHAAPPAAQRRAVDAMNAEIGAPSRGAQRASWSTGVGSRRSWPSLMAPDGVHATPDGYGAARGCSRRTIGELAAPSRGESAEAPRRAARPRRRAAPRPLRRGPVRRRPRRARWLEAADPNRDAPPEPGRRPAARREARTGARRRPSLPTCSACRCERSRGRTSCTGRGRRTGWRSC